MIRIEFETDNSAFSSLDCNNSWQTETARLLHEAAKRIADGETFPLKIRDANGNAVGFADHIEAKPDEEIVVTTIAGKLHRWIFYPGKWVPFEPQANQLMRMRR